MLRRPLLAAVLVLWGGCGDDSSSSSDGDAAIDGAVDVGPPTASSWLGVNVSGDLPWTDVTHMLNGFQATPEQLDADGYPLPGVSATSQSDMGFLLPSGSYKISYEGSGTLAVSGIATLDGGWQTVGDEHRGTLTVTGTPGEFGRFLTLSISNTGAQTVRSIRIYMPGVDYGSTEMFRPELLRLLAPFRTLRFMDWQATNGSTVTEWSQRSSPTRFGAGGAGVALEHIAALANITGKDAWITVPQSATDDYVRQMARLVAAELDVPRIAAARAAQGITTPFELIVEYSNETWNGGFSAYQTLLDAANANSTRYTGTYDGTYGPSWMSGNANLMKVGQYQADRLVTIGTIFKEELGANAAMVKPVLAGWALGAVFSDVGLRFIAAHHGTPKDYVAYVALAPYFAADDAQTSTLDALFADVSSDIAEKHPGFVDFAQLGVEHGIAIAAYEGGQHITGTTNQPIKHLAQHDRRMHDAYMAYMTLWRQDLGDALFCHFTLAGTPGIPETIYQYGYWGSIIGMDEDPSVCSANLPTLTGTEDIASVVHNCPKYKALVEQALD